MNDVRRKEIRRALALIGEAKGILEVALDGAGPTFTGVGQILPELVRKPKS